MRNTMGQPSRRLCSTPERRGRDGVGLGSPTHEPNGRSSRQLQRFLVAGSALLAIAAAGALAQDRPVRLADLQCRTPKWSPDGTKIAFAAKSNGNLDIYTITADGTGLRRLTDEAGDEFGPCWSPNGARIAFAWEQGGNTDVWVMKADGSDRFRLTDDPANDRSPAWSPDGGKIAFVSDRDGNDEIYLMDGRGKGVTRLTEHPASDVTPRWSPDGKRIAFASDRDGLYQLFVMAAGGSDVAKIGPGVARNPSWSPNGDRIAYGGTNEAQNPRGPMPNSVCILTVGDASVAVPAAGSMGHAPDWSPDGTRIVFARNFRLYVMNADGSELREVADAK